MLVSCFQRAVLPARSLPRTLSRSFSSSPLSPFYLAFEHNGVSRNSVNMPDDLRPEFDALRYCCDTEQVQDLLEKHGLWQLALMPLKPDDVESVELKSYYGDWFTVKVRVKLGVPVATRDWTKKIWSSPATAEAKADDLKPMAATTASVADEASSVTFSPLLKTRPKEIKRRRQDLDEAEEKEDEEEDVVDESWTPDSPDEDFLNEEERLEKVADRLEAVAKRLEEWSKENAQASQGEEAPFDPLTCATTSIRSLLSPLSSSFAVQKNDPRLKSLIADLNRLTAQAHLKALFRDGYFVPGTGAAEQLPGLLRLAAEELERDGASEGSHKQ